MKAVQLRFDWNKRRSAGPLFFIAVAVAFLGLLTWGEYDSWRSEIARIEEDVTSAAVSLARHADGVVKLASVPVAALVAELEFEGMTRKGIDEVRDLIVRLKKDAEGVSDLFVFDEAGNLLATSASIPTSEINVASRAYFAYHSASADRSYHLGDPILSRTRAQWLIPISMRIDHADGSFAGIAVATISTRYFSDFYLTLQTGQHSATALIRGDGVVLARAPYDINVVGRDASDTSLFTEYLKHADTGVYHYHSPLDDTDRIGGFHRSARSQMVVLNAVGLEDALASWMAGAQYRWASIVLLAITAGVLGIRLLQQARRQSRSDQLLASREWEFRVLAESTSDMVCRIDTEGLVRYISPASRQIIGADPATVVGRNPLDFVVPEDLANVEAAVVKVRSGENATVEHRRAVEGGEAIWLETTLSPLPLSEDADQNGTVSVTRDITSRKMLEAALAEMATSDWLTGLANRRAFDQRCAAEALRSRRSGAPLSLILIDVDRFKLYNDSYGHDQGDRCLKAVAAALKASVRRPADLVARYGGEEFAVLLPETDAAGALVIAQALRSAVEQLAIAHERNLPWQCATISVGLATCPDGQAEIDALVRAADAELYAAKNGGRNQLHATLVAA